MRKERPDQYVYCVNQKLLALRKRRVDMALMLLGAKLWHSEVTLMHAMRAGMRYYGPLPNKSVYEQLAAIGKDEEKLAQLEGKARKYRKLKRAAKRRGVDFEEYVLWKAAPIWRERTRRVQEVCGLRSGDE